jgi:hypothetical protein
MNKKTILIVAALAVVGVVTSFSADAKTDGEGKAGLVGIRFGSGDFTDPDEIVTLSSLDNFWTEMTDFLAICNAGTQQAENAVFFSFKS